MNNLPQTSIQELWQHQPVQGTRMSIEEIRKRAARFERRIFWRNAREYAAGGLAIVLLGYFFAHAHDTLGRMAFALLIAGLSYMLLHLYRKGASGSTSAHASDQCAEFFLRELERQRDLISNLWWYVGPLVPGLALSMVSGAIAHPQPMALLRLAVAALFITGGILGLIKMNSHAARCLQKQIDELRLLQGAHEQSS